MRALAYMTAAIAALAWAVGFTSAADAPTRLAEAEVIRIASAAAEKKGFRLKDYKAPRVHYEFTKKDKSWTVFYDGKVSSPGNHFLVWINDQTGAATVMPGE